jgi:hypothetical protein
MTFEEAATEAHTALRSKLPAVQRKKWLQIARDVCAVVALLAFIIAGVDNISVRHEAHATKVQASCINSILADRNGTSQADAEAHLNFAKAILALLTSPAAATAAEREAAVQAFVVETQSYVATLTADQQYRTDHPLGKC